MKITGLVVEYNPMHLGHLHHIKEARRLTHCDVLVAVMSPHFTQRGEPACVDKFKRTTAALNHGVDVVLELPTIFATQSAQVFAKQAIEILHRANVDTIVFGSESNDIKVLEEIADLPVNMNYFKEKMDLGYSYAQAMSASDSQLYPNDILGVSYVREAKKLGMNFMSIKRSTHYHDKSLDNRILSASAIREARKNQIETQQSLVDLSDFVEPSLMYPYLRHALISKSKEELKNNLLVSEGIENLLKEHAMTYENYDDFLKASTSRRYSTSRIQRICTQIFLNHTKEDSKNINHHFIRVLGFNKKVSSYLGSLETTVAMKVKELPRKYIDLEINATMLYSLLSKQTDLIHQEAGKVIIIE